MPLNFISAEDPEIKEIRKGGGVLLLFGLPFLLLGLGMLALGFGLMLGLLEPEAKTMPWYFALPIGSIFAGAGAVMMFGRAGWRLDRREKKVIRWWGLLRPWKRTEYSLENYRRLSLGQETRGSGKDSVPVFPVRLEGEGEVKAPELEAPQNYQEARRLAEETAKFLHWPLEDTSLGTRVRREPEQLDEPLFASLQRRKEKSEWAVLPAGSKIQVRDEAGATVFELPAPGFTPALYLQMLVPFVFAGLVAYFFLLPMLRLPAPGFVRYIFLAFAGLGFIVFPIWTGAQRALAAARKRTRVVVSASSVRVEAQSFWKQTGKEIPTAELEELLLPDQPAFSLENRLPDGTVLPPNPRLEKLTAFLYRLAPRRGLIARSDRLTIEFGHGLSEPELRYLNHAVKQKLASLPRS